MTGYYTMPTHPVRLVTLKDEKTVELEKKSGRLNLSLEESLKQAVKDFAARSGMDVAEFARQAFTNEMERQGKGEIDDDELEGAPLLDISAACGPITEAREQSSQSFYVSQDVADEISFDSDGDFFQRARGFSMQGAGILDEDILCWSPLPKGRHPQLGEVALIVVHDQEGDAFSTAKYWYGEQNNMPQLRDGEGIAYPLPETLHSAVPVAVLKGRIGAAQIRRK